MKTKTSPLLRKAFWLLLTVFLVFAQLANAAELTQAELQAMPTVSITYYTMEGGEPMVLDALPTLSPQGKAYWAMLPVQAFSYPMTLTITPSETAPYTFTPQSGDTLVTDVTTSDYEGTSTLITAYQNSIMVDTYRLYISTMEMPLIVAPAEVPVYYVDSEDNANVLHYEVVTAYYDQNNLITVNPDLVPANYTLIGESSATVTVNELGQATPEWVTFYFAPQAVQGTLYIYYTDFSGLEIASSQTRALDPGTYTITPSPSNLPAGYVLSPESPTQVEVTVDSIGTVTPEVVTFEYELEIVTGFLTVNYTDESGTPLLAPETLTLGTGTHTITPNSTIIPSGYMLSATSQTQFSVTVDSLGAVTPASVTFVYTPEQVVPVTGDLIIYYTDLGGTQLIPPQTRTLEQGQHVIIPDDAAIPSEYSLSATSPSQVTVSVDATGAVSPLSVTFVYEQVPVEPATGTLTVQYLNSEGAQVASPQTVTLQTGTHNIGIEASTIPEGYTLAEGTPSAFTVTVDASGVVSPATITFTLAAVQAVEPILTPVESYAITNAPAVNLRSTPDSTSATNIAFPTVPQGTQVWVYGTFVVDGREWASIRYNDTDCYVWYSLIDLVTETAAPVNGTLTVRYLTAGSVEIAGNQILSLAPGSYTVAPDAGHVPAGYSLTEGSAAQYTVTVDESGVTSPDTIIFTYAADAGTETPTAAPTEAPTEIPTTSPALGEPADISVSYPDYFAIGASAVTNTTAVRFRSEPSTASADTILYQVNMGTEVWVHGIFTAGDMQWAYIRYENTDCYVLFSLLDLDPAYVTPSPSPTIAPTESPTQAPPTDTPEPGEPADISATYPDYTAIGALANTNSTGVRLRSAPDSSTDSNIVFTVSLGTEVWVHGSFSVGDRTWAYIRYEGMDCYVWLSLLDMDASYISPSPSPTTSPTESPMESPTVSPDETPVATPGEDDQPADISATYPDYTVIGRPGNTNTTSVRLRSAPNSASDSNIVFTVTQGTGVWVHGSFTVSDREWAYVRYANTDCYVWLSLLDLDMTFVTPTPTPTLAPTPTPSPTLAPTDSPTPTTVPTDTPTPSPSVIPSESPTTSPTETVPGIEMYVGYAVTLSQVALRNDANFVDGSIIATLPADTLLYLNGQQQAGATIWTGAQTRLGDSIIGLLPFDAVRTITPGEAQVYIDAYNAQHGPTPTPTPSHTPAPAQQTGYFLTLGDNVPLRNVPGSQSAISAWIAEDQVVYVNGQVYYEGYGWHVSNYNNLSGYIREDQLRPMSAQEIAAYLAQNAPTPTPAQTAAPYNPTAPSSYGYVTASSVNFRQSPGGTRIKVLNQYAFGLVLGTQTVNGTVWYNVNQAGTVGWVSANYFTVLNLTELQSFLNSSEYLQGIVNSGSSTSTSSSSSTSGSATQGQVSAVEDWNVGVWQNPSGSLNASYEPFNPYATPTAPLTTEAPTPEPTSTFVIGTMIPITYEEETKETQTGSNWVGLVLGGIVLIGGAGGVYAYALTQNKKRKAAARASAARQRSQQQNATQNPYARRAAAAPPTAAGQQPKSQNPYQRPNPYAQPPQQTTERTPNPYAQRPAPNAAPPQQSQDKPQAPANPYARPQQPSAPDTADSGNSSEQPHTKGRRSSHYENRDDDNT